MVTAFNLAIGTGIIAASLVGYFLNDLWSWQWMIAIAALPAAILLILMIWPPDTPRWLASKHRMDNARGFLQRVRPGGTKVDDELNNIQGVTKRD